MEIDNFLDEVEEQKNRPDKVTNGLTLLFEDIVKIDKKEFTFEGRETPVLRYFYTLEDGRSFIIPKSLHVKVVLLRKEGGKSVTGFKVILKGSGINTSYDAVPVTV